MKRVEKKEFVRTSDVAESLRYSPPIVRETFHGMARRSL